jgi:uncharacterized membrane protein YccC
MPDQTITMSMVQVALGVGGLMFTGACVLWAVVRYLDGRREESSRALYERIQAEAKAANERIDRVRDDTVRREEWHEDRRRLDERLAALTNTIRETMQSVSARLETITARIDQILTGRAKGGE